MASKQVINALKKVIAKNGIELVASSRTPLSLRGYDATSKSGKECAEDFIAECEREDLLHDFLDGFFEVLNLEYIRLGK